MNIGGIPADPATAGTAAPETPPAPVNRGDADAVGKPIPRRRRSRRRDVTDTTCAGRLGKPAPTAAASTKTTQRAVESFRVDIDALGASQSRCQPRHPLRGFLSQPLQLLTKFLWDLAGHADTGAQCSGQHRWHR
ncbi:hypothetical protein I551_7269 [Mycobacterium ulcerans str. Harvey]|uniref:Uncharacterized protein n=1 Tax=Mycobacterium ulcerans str. Harvey TaxID=1299332 RepID=A0ABP3A9L8_MYCUL|nr:hypothetical protein I551_7269 [Mycobacterium ulcerans str. Harvey]